MYYFETPNYSVSLNAKVASSTMARLIIKHFHPQIHKKITYARFPNGITENKKQWQWMCPGSRDPNKPIVLLVRNPVDRFITACQQIGINQNNVTRAIDSLIDDTPFLKIPENIDKIEKMNEQRLKNRQERLDKGLSVKPYKRIGYLRDDIHFVHQHSYIKGQTYLFKFADHLKDCFEFIGIKNTETLVINKAKRQKPILSQDQIEKVKQYYQKDIKLFDTLINPGQLIYP